MAGVSIPSEKQNGCKQLRANLAATLATELLLLRTQPKLQEVKQEEKLRILQMTVSIDQLGVRSEWFNALKQIFESPLNMTGYQQFWMARWTIQRSAIASACKGEQSWFSFPQTKSTFPR